MNSFINFRGRLMEGLTHVEVDVTYYYPTPKGSIFWLYLNCVFHIKTIQFYTIQFNFIKDQYVFVFIGLKYFESGPVLMSPIFAAFVVNRFCISKTETYRRPPVHTSVGLALMNLIPWCVWTRMSASPSRAHFLRFYLSFFFPPRSHSFFFSFVFDWTVRYSANAL